MKLPRQQLAVLEAASADEPISITEVAAATDLPEETVTGVAFELEDMDLLDVTEETHEQVLLTEEGAEYAEDGLPEVRLYEAAISLGADEAAAPMGQVIGEFGLGGALVDIALSNYARKGYGSIENSKLSADGDADPESDPEARVLASLEAGEASVDDDVLQDLVRRDLVTVDEQTVRSVQVTEQGVTELMAGIETADEVGQLTTEMITSGEWQDVEFAEYNVEADAETMYPGKPHVLRQTAERVKEVLVGMGFQEMAGPHADSEFWINDCLFMPQDHPARTHWDQFALDVPPMEDIPEDLMKEVENAHRNGVGPDGDGYTSPWTEEMARGIDLRGHTTNLSMRYLSGHGAHGSGTRSHEPRSGDLAIGDLEPPQRYFSVEKVYRNDTLDATHLLEFFQIEGWVMAEDLSVRDLMGTFTEFYSQFGIHDIQFKPHYNPYTEPSFELFGRHPRTNALIEIGNSGIFRPEVLEPLGVECDVMAWGLALERLLMLVLGAEDIRDVHGTLVDLEFLRETEVQY